MKPFKLKSLLAAAALCAAPAFAQGPAAGGESAPAAPDPAPAPEGRAPVLPRIMPSGPKFDALSPADREHVRRMAEIRAARDAAEQEILRLRQKAEERREAILAENEEAKALSEDAQRLLAEYASKTNALQAILDKDEALSGLFREMQPAKALVESNQRSLNAEAAAAMQRRMREQREAVAARKAAAEAAEKGAEGAPAPVASPALSESETK